MLGLDHRDGLGMPVDRMKAAKAFEEACELGATFHCRRAESLYLEQLIRRAYATQLPDAKAYAERGIADVQSFYVLEARLSEAKPQAGDMERELERQQGQMYDPNSIVPGSSVVLSVRTFYTGRAGWTDDSSFEKISVELPSLHEDVVVDVAAPNVRFYYASGSSSWSPTAGDRFALHATGTVRISSVDERTGIVGAQLDLTFRPRDIKCSGLEGESEPKTIHEARWFARKSREQLSAWQGGSRRNLRNFP
jgi:hypothetical protein